MTSRNEDSRSLAFLDIHPINIGHTLVIPKKHIENIFEISEDELSYLSKIVKKMSHAILETFNSDGIKIAQSNGKAAGQVVPHLHIHVIPRRPKDGMKGFFWPRRPYKDEAEAVATAEALRSAIAELNTQTA